MEPQLPAPDGQSRWNVSRRTVVVLSPPSIRYRGRQQRWRRSTAEDPGARPVIFANPLSDGEFVAFVDVCVEQASSPRRLQDALRRRYPGAIVRPRVLDGESISVWYAYRDGKWIQSGGLEDVHE